MRKIKKILQAKLFAERTKMYIDQMQLLKIIALILLSNISTYPLFADQFYRKKSRDSYVIVRECIESKDGIRVKTCLNNTECPIYKPAKDYECVKSDECDIESGFHTGIKEFQFYVVNNWADSRDLFKNVSKEGLKRTLVLLKADYKPTAAPAYSGVTFRQIPKEELPVPGFSNLYQVYQPETIDGSTVANAEWKDSITHLYSQEISGCPNPK